MENADKNRQYVFCVLHQEITNDNMSLLRNQIVLFSQFSIQFIDIRGRIGNYNLFISRHLTVEAYFRLFIPELLSEYHKAIYLDGDMICCGNIAELFDINLDGYLLAAVQDVAIAWYHSKKEIKHFNIFHQGLLGLKNPEEYFNSGMLVFNIDLFRKTTSTDALLELAASREWQVHDQDVLNYAAEGKTLILPLYWNFMYNRRAKYLPAPLKQKYDEAAKKPKIIHYINIKPWEHEVFFSYFELFWKYATRTPFIGSIVERMQSKELISSKTFKERIIVNIIHKRGIGIRFILIDCLKAWLLRDKG